MRRSLMSLVVTVLASPLAGCEFLSDSALPLLPTVSYKSSALASSPSRERVSAYLCPEVVPSPASLLCSGFFGSQPRESDLDVAFRLGYGVDNPNPIPLPLTQLLTAVTLFPDATSGQKLGAACTVFCAPDDADCTGEAGPNDCQSGQEDIRTMADFQNAATDLVLSKGLELARGGDLSYRIPTAIPEGETDFASIFGLAPRPLLQSLEQLASQSISELAAGNEVTLTIPFELEGTVWFDTGTLGRAAVPYGPVRGTWTLPAEAIAREAANAAVP